MGMSTVSGAAAGRVTNVPARPTAGAMGAPARDAAAEDEDGGGGGGRVSADKAAASARDAFSGAALAAGMGGDD